MRWKHTGFSVHNGVRIAKGDDVGKENVAQHIIRNTFSLDKLIYIEETGMVISTEVVKNVPRKQG